MVSFKIGKVIFIKNKAIAEELFRQDIEKWKTTNRIQEQISDYKIQNIIILNDQAFHGFDFKIVFEVLPADKDQYVIAGGSEPLENGWVLKGLSGKVYEVNEGTYVLLGLGGGPVTDIQF